jgi:hypothetical protein
MTDIEPKEVFRQKAIDLINEYRQVRGDRLIQFLEINTPEISAFIRSIQLHEKTKQEFADFKQEVGFALSNEWHNLHDGAKRNLDRFRIPLPKPDPLVEVLLDMELSSDQEEGQHDAKWLRLKLDALGFEIREKGQ